MYRQTRWEYGTTVHETIRSSATSGERILFHTLKNHLDDDYIV